MGVTPDKLDDGSPKLRKTYARALMEEVRGGLASTNLNE